MRCWAQLPWHCPHGRLGIQANASPCVTTLFPAVAFPIRYWEVLHPGVNRFDVDREGKNNECRPGFADARWSDAFTAAGRRTVPSRGISCTATPPNPSPASPKVPQAVDRALRPGIAPPLRARRAPHPLVLS